ncbi:MAG: hypothetical protein HC780_13305 [Leptolyngbyaceae cyanobacterium CSU_1_3]|nr:hypothetical protein [Leptolyngbyaceae cyanobacterium CSU_1_3]
MDADKDTIYLRIQKDSDNNGQFTEQDETAILKTKISDPAIGTEVISPEMQKKIKSIVFS